HAALGGIRGLPNGLRHLAGLAVTETHATLLVTDDDEGGEAEAATALYNLGDAIDVDQAIHELAVALLALTRLTFSSHIFFSTDAGRLRSQNMPPTADSCLRCGTHMQCARADDKSPTRL